MSHFCSVNLLTMTIDHDPYHPEGIGQGQRSGSGSNAHLFNKTTNMQKTCPEISELKQQIEESVGRKMKTSNDFTFLSGAIWERVHENISTSTLKRLWGYVDGADARWPR